MKRKILLFSALAGLLSLTLSSYREGMVKGLVGLGTENRTGSPTPAGYLGQADCSSGSGCHDNVASPAPFSLNFSLIDQADGSLSTGSYLPGHLYTVKVTGAYTTPPATTLPCFGFQIACTGWHGGHDRFSSSPFAGAPAVKRGSPADYGWNPFTKQKPTAVDTFLYSGAYCIENTNTLSNHIGSNRNSYEVDVNWLAPDASQGDSIGFWYILCAVDSDGTTANDVTVKGPTEGVVFWRATEDVNKVFNNVSFTSFPNPVKDQLYVRMSNLQTGAYGVNVFDMSGRKIYTQNLNVTNSSYTASINAATWPNGIYQVQFTKDGGQHTVSVVKQ